MRPFSSRAAFVVSLALAAAPAAAQNLLTNAGFATDTAGWTYSGGAGNVAWSPLDATGRDGSGSALLTAASPSAGISAYLGQCLAATAGSYTFGGAVRVPSGQGRTGLVSIAFVPYDTTDCSGSGLEFQTTPGASTTDEWEPLSTTVSAPAATRSAQLLFVVRKDGADGELRAHGDDLFVLRGAAPANLVIPASASIRGAGAAFFQTDVWLVNRSRTNPLPVSGRLRCLSGIACAGAGTTPSLTIPPRQSVLLSDVVGLFFGSPSGAGAIEWSYSPSVGRLTVLSRTYTPSLPSPTNGTGIPALALADATSRALFGGLGHNGGSLASGFRTNAGVYNPNASTVSVTFTLRSEGAGLLGTATESWGPNEARQINDVFGALGAGSTVTRNAYLEVAASLAVFPYVTLIDNQSGDSVFVAASPDEAP